DSPRLRADYGLALFALRTLVGSCRNRKSIQRRFCSLCGQCSSCGMVSECRTIDLLSCAPGRRQRAYHGQQFRAGDSFVSCRRARASDGAIGGSGVGPRLYARPGARRTAYLCFRVAFEFVSIGGACGRWFGCCPLSVAAGKFQGLVGEKRAVRFFWGDHLRVQYLFAFTRSGHGTKGTWLSSVVGIEFFGGVVF